MAVGLCVPDPASGEAPASSTRYCILPTSRGSILRSQRCSDLRPPTNPILQARVIEFDGTGTSARVGLHERSIFSKFIRLVFNEGTVQMVNEPALVQEQK